MNLHEYQAKALLRSFGVAVPEGRCIRDISEAQGAAAELETLTGTSKFAVKAQIHAGGRGKGGGVKIAGNLTEVTAHVSSILGMKLITPQTPPEGKTVSKVLIEENIYYPGSHNVLEFYISLLLNRANGRNLIMYSPKGGMDIEQVAEESPEYIFTEEIHPVTGLAPFQCRRIAFNLGLSGESFRNMVSFLSSLYKAYIGTDASLLEINPVIRAADERIFAADCKLVVDNNALFRHQNISEMRDTAEENPVEVEAGKFGLNFIKLDGNVGCMVNGAGLAMATMDIIKLSGGEPANFLDVGGSANAARVENAFRIILSDPGVKVILINIFGGIVRCDRVANGIVDACRNIGNIEIPIIIRLQGTNALEARQIIDNSGLKVYPATLLEEAAELVAKALN